MQQVHQIEVSDSVRVNVELFFKLIFKKYFYIRRNITFRAAVFYCRVSLAVCGILSSTRSWLAVLMAGSRFISAQNTV